MNNDDVTLQELIVRALTGRDHGARSTLEAAAAGDPELMRFCAELEDVVSMLHGSPDWRAAAPSAELTAKIRQAVVSKLPAAPPHFRTVMLEADLGRRRATRNLVIISLLLIVALIAAIASWPKPKSEGERLKLSGKLLSEAALKAGEPLSAWTFAREEKWEIRGEGLHSSGGEDAGAAFLKEALSADAALAMNVDVHVPELGDRSNVTIFLTDAEGETGPSFDAASRPRSALALEIAADGLVLNGPGRSLLHSKPDSNADGRFYRIRMEYLGRFARVLINNETFFDGPIPQPMRGPLYAGVRVAGPKKNDIFFNTVRLER
ncbi:MAG TPA: hypothetical protein VEK08_02515 [Planctomycetota bacterium]|nr:hypothetical protein [Planctomycetota bacterium]